jgi:hypothetical protein
MDLWDQVFFGALVDDTEAEALGKPAASRVPDDETRAKAYNTQVLSGRIRSAIRTLTRREGGGVLEPDTACTKTGLPVLEVLRSKHPAMRDPNPADIGVGAFESYEDTPQPIPQDITGDIVEEVASKLSGGAGPGGTDAVALQSWLLRFGAESQPGRAGLPTRIPLGQPTGL